MKSPSDHPKQKCGRTSFPKALPQKTQRMTPHRTPFLRKRRLLCPFAERSAQTALHLRHPLLQASPECGTPGSPGGTSCDSVLTTCTTVHNGDTLSHFWLLGKPFTAFYSRVSSFIPEGEFCYGMTFFVLYRSMGGTSSGLPIVSSHSSAFSWGGRCGTGSLSGSSSGGATRSFGLSAPSKPWARPSGLASPCGGLSHSSPAPRRHWPGRGRARSPPSLPAGVSIEFIAFPPYLHKGSPIGPCFMQFFRSCFRERGSPNGEDFYPQTRRFPQQSLVDCKGKQRSILIKDRSGGVQCLRKRLLREERDERKRLEALLGRTAGGAAGAAAAGGRHRAAHPTLSADKTGLPASERRRHPSAEGREPPESAGLHRPHRDDSTRLSAALPECQSELHPCAGSARRADRTLRGGRSLSGRLLPRRRPGPLPGSTSLSSLPARGHPLSRLCAVRSASHR